MFFGAIRADNIAGMVLKFFLGKLVYSTSDGAALFLLGFAVLALLCMSLAVDCRTQKIAVFLLWGGMTIGYGTHLTATLTYFNEHQIPLSAHIYHWADGVNSYTSLLHSHQGKTAMFSDIGWLPASSRYDAGLALAETVPTIISWLIGIAFLAALSGALLGMPTFHDGYGHRTGLVVAYIVALATALKSIFDGGLLAYAILPSLLLIASVTFNRNEMEWLRFWRRYGLTIGSISIAGYASLWIALTPGNDLPLLGPWLFILAVLVVLSTWSSCSTAAWIIRIALLSYIAINSMFDYGDNLAPLLRPISSNDRIISFDAHGHMTTHPVEGFGGQPIFRVYRYLGDDPWKPYKTLVWNNSVRGSENISVSFRVMDWQGQQGQLSPTPALRAKYIGVTGNLWIQAGFSVNSTVLPPIVAYGIGSALSKNNYYVWLYQIDLLLRNSGWRSYVLMPHTVSNPILTVQ